MKQKEIPQCATETIRLFKMEVLPFGECAPFKNTTIEVHTQAIVAEIG